MDKYNKTKKDIVETAMRSAVFDAAVKIINEEGIEALQMQRIASHAGVSIGTLYNYFKGKDDLLIYVDERLCEEFFDTLSNAAESDLTPDKKIIDLTQKVYGFINSNKDIFEFLELYDVYRKVPEKHKFEHRQEFIELFSRVIQDGIDQNYFTKVNPQTAAEMLHACMIGVFKVNLEFKEFIPELEWNELTKMFSAYLGITID